MRSILLLTVLAALAAADLEGDIATLAKNDGEAFWHKFFLMSTTAGDEEELTKFIQRQKPFSRPQLIAKALRATVQNNGATIQDALTHLKSIYEYPGAWFPTKPEERPGLVELEFGDDAVAEIEPPHGEPDPGLTNEGAAFISSGGPHVLGKSLLRPDNGWILRLTQTWPEADVERFLPWWYLIACTGVTTRVDKKFQDSTYRYLALRMMLDAIPANNRERLITEVLPSVSAPIQIQILLQHFHSLAPKERLNVAMAITAQADELTTPQGRSGKSDIVELLVHTKQPWSWSRLLAYSRSEDENWRLAVVTVLADQEDPVPVGDTLKKRLLTMQANDPVNVIRSAASRALRNVR